MKWPISGLSVGIVLFAPTLVLACICGRPRDPLEEMEQVDFVFQGEVLSSVEARPRFEVIDGETTLVKSTDDMVRWDFKVGRVWKGDIPDTIRVYSESSDVSCGYRFKVGGVYLIYGYLDDGNHRTPCVWPDKPMFPIARATLCSRTRPIDQAHEDITKLPRPLRGH